MGIMVYIVVCAIAFLLIYAIDLFLVNYHMTSRKEFGETPVKVDPLQYFVDNIPNVLGYTDHTLEYGVTCFEVMSYEETDTQESFRCCDAGDGSLVSRVFFQAVDENCIIACGQSWACRQPWTTHMNILLMVLARRFGSVN